MVEEPNMRLRKLLETPEPKKKKHAIMNYYIYSPESNTSSCNCYTDDDKMIKCSTVMTGSKTSNLKSHLQRKHPEEYKEFLVSQNFSIIDEEPDPIPITKKSFVTPKRRRAREQHAILNYYIYCPESNKSTCDCYKDKTSKCLTILKGKKTSNLIKHLQCKHPAQYKEFRKLYKNFRKSTDRSTFIQRESGTKNKKSVREYNRRQRVGILVKKNFKYDPEKGKSRCTCIDITTMAQCGAEFKGSKTDNLKRHLYKQHPDYYSEIYDVDPSISVDEDREVSSQLYPELDEFITIEENKTFFRNMKSEQDIINIDEEQFGSANVAEMYLNQNSVSITDGEIPVYMKIDTFIDGIVEMVTVDGNPFSIFEEEGFGKIICPILKAFKFDIGNDSIANLIHKRYVDLLNKFKLLVENTLFNVKVDCLTIMGRSFIAIHIQFVLETEIKVITICAKEITPLIDAINLKLLILLELEKYELKTEQIYSITAGNGSTFLDNMRIFEEPADYDQSEQDQQDVIDNCRLVEMVQNCDLESEDIQRIPCAVYLLQQAILDTLKNADSDHVTAVYVTHISKARSAVEELQSTHMAPRLKTLNLPTPVLDSSINWNSTYEMLDGLIGNFKPVWKQLEIYSSKLLLSEDTWEKVYDVVKCLKICDKAILSMQAENVTLTDVFKHYNIFSMEIAEMGDAFSQELLRSLVKKKSLIFENDAFYAALYLDSRFNFELKAHEKEAAINQLLCLHDKIKGLKGDVNFTILDDFDKSDFDNLDQSERKYQELLIEKYRSQMSAAPNSDFEAQCRAFCSIHRLKITENILEFWNGRKDMYPELYATAETLFALPATQLTVGSFISQIKYMLDPANASLDPELMDKILFLKVNYKNLNDILA